MEYKVCACFPPLLFVSSVVPNFKNYVRNLFALIFVEHYVSVENYC